MREQSRLVVVTGGGTGIGRAIASVFLGKGDEVVILGRRSDVLERAVAELSSRKPAGSAAIKGRRLDVSKLESVKEAVRWVRDECRDQIDVLINNAGFVRSVSADASPEEAERVWDEVLDTNLKGAYLMSRVAQPYLRRPGGRIINMSSIAAFTGTGGVYSAAKAGVIGLTHALAAELGPHGITVNAISPGYVEATEFFGDRMTPQRRERLIGVTPVGRPGRPEEIAGAAVYLASPEAGFVNGEVLHVNGGWLFGR
jgi:3-oxoacyl-[acyl-carrier protein] reductase